ncbi:MAG: Na+/H+ antiporter NhaC family protein [Acidaminococcaceae bacterium]|jgi:Na+/H+ antiporter NhaC|nr:Na+/H+ antiporter NhaC family protein [Acidaminococcaceae bacterium]
MSSLIPFAIFVVVYLGSGLVLEAQGVKMAFYQFPAPVAAVIGILVAFILLKGKFEDKFNTFLEGCGDSNILIMCVIYLLAGAFAAVCKAMGGLDATVNLGLNYVPTQYLAAGIFIITAFISLATGTSVGSVVAVGPIAISIAEKTGMGIPMLLGVVLGGSMFGDNLSVISDTTIAATRTQGCSMRDKFRLNLWLTLIPAIITVVILLFTGNSSIGKVALSGEINYIKVLPYVVVLVGAIAGGNVFAVLFGGTVLAGLIGFYYGSFTCITYAQTIYAGFTGMTDIFLLSLLIGGLANMINKAGGITALLKYAQKFISGRRSAEVAISALVSLTDIAVANNTVAIIINGEVARSLCYKFKVDPRRSAALLDTFSNVFQGLIPYGAQMLIITGFTKGSVSPIDLLPHAWFLYLLFLSSLISIFVPFSNGVIVKDPWNYEKQKPESEVNDAIVAEEAIE